MNDIFPPVVKALAPHLSASDSAEWSDAFAKYLPPRQINTQRRIAAFLGQVCEESGQFTTLSENLNYSASRLCVVWPSRFPSVSDAIPYAYNPEKLANRVYADRLGNGNEASGDGWKYRGVGLIQITGASLYKQYAANIGRSVDDAIAFMQTKEGAVDSACWYWNMRNLNPLADQWNTQEITFRVNGGYVNLATRQQYSNLALQVLSKQ